MFLRLYLFIARRDTRKNIGTSDKLWLRWCFSLIKKLSGEKDLLFLCIVPRKTLSCFLGRGS